MENKTVENKTVAGIVELKAKVYAICIYKGGTNRLTARDGYAGVASGYYEATEMYAAKNFTRFVIDTAHDKGWINETEYTETIAYKDMLVPVPAATGDAV